MNPSPALLLPGLTPAKRSRPLGFLALVFCLASLHAAMPVETLRKVVSQHQDSVLHFGGQIKFLCGRCPREHQFPMLGTAVVADAKGIFLISTTGPLADPKTEIRGSSLHVRTPEGTEVPVRITVTDVDLGVAVVRLDQDADATKHTFNALDLESSARARVLDELIVLRRHDVGTGFAASASAAQVNAIKTKPRLVYFPTGVSPAMGMAPCFDASGKLVALSTADAGAMAPDELTDLLAQARTKTLKEPATKEPAKP